MSPGKRDCRCAITFVTLGLGCAGGDSVCEGERDHLEDEGGVEEEQEESFDDGDDLYGDYGDDEGGKETGREGGSK